VAEDSSFRLPFAGLDFHYRPIELLVNLWLSQQHCSAWKLQRIAYTHPIGDAVYIEDGSTAAGATSRN
jgi:hypothetical protein